MSTYFQKITTPWAKGGGSRGRPWYQFFFDGFPYYRVRVLSAHQADGDVGTTWVALWCDAGTGEPVFVVCFVVAQSVSNYYQAVQYQPETVKVWIITAPRRRILCNGMTGLLFNHLSPAVSRNHQRLIQTKSPCAWVWILRVRYENMRVEPGNLGLNTVFSSSAHTPQAIAIYSNSAPDILCSPVPWPGTTQARMNIIYSFMRVLRFVWKALSQVRAAVGHNCKLTWAENFLTHFLRQNSFNWVKCGWTGGQCHRQV